MENTNSRRESDLRGALDAKKSEIDNESNDSKKQENTVKDYQLNRAIELIRSISVYENIKKAS